MASVAFTLAGNKLASYGLLLGSEAATAAGKAALTVAGTLIDREIFGPSGPKPQTLDALRFPRVDEGSEALWCAGQAVRIPGQVVWASDPRKYVHNDGRVDYMIDAYFRFAKRRSESFAKLWVGGEVQYDNSKTSIVLSGTDIEQVTDFPESQNATYYPEYRAPAGGTDLSQFLVNKVATVSGFSHPGNNLSRLVVFAEFAPSLNEYVLRLLPDQYYDPVEGQFVTNDDTEPEGPGPTITISQVSSPWKYTSGVYATGTQSRFYLGDRTVLYDGTVIDAQDPDPYVESKVGVGKWPAHRGWTGCLITNMRITHTGGTMPEVEALIVPDSSATLASVLQEVIERNGKVLKTQYELSDVPTRSFLGLIVNGIVPPMDLIKQVAWAHDLGWNESGGVLRFFDRRQASRIEVKRANLSVGRSARGDADFPLRVVDEGSLKTPQQVSVGFIDPTNDYQVGSRPGRVGSRQTGAVTHVGTPLVMTPAEAKLLAKRKVHIAHWNRKPISAQLPVSAALVAQEGDILVAPSDSARPYQARLQSVARGADFTGRVEGVEERVEVYDQTAFVEVDEEDATIDVPAVLTQLVLDLPPLTDEHATVPVQLFGAHTQNPLVLFPGANALMSPDGVQTYTFWASVPRNATAGITDTALGAPSFAAQWDHENTVRVVLFNGSLTSLDTSSVLAGGNLIAIGQEVLAFADAELVDIDTYELSTLLRGLRGTEAEMGGHTSGERAVLLDADLFPRAQNVSDIGQTRWFKTVPNVGNDDYPGEEIELVGRSILPFAPWQLRFEVGNYGDAATDIRATWSYQSRGVGQLFGEPNVFGAAELHYELEVWNPADSAVVSTHTIEVPSDQFDASYDILTTAQSGAGYTPGTDAVNVRIYEVSTINGQRGPALVGQVGP